MEGLIVGDNGCGGEVVVVNRGGLLVVVLGSGISKEVAAS